jgi:hypothetical protein
MDGKKNGGLAWQSVSFMTKEACREKQKLTHSLRNYWSSRASDSL